MEMDEFHGKNNDTRRVRRVENEYSQPEDIYENPLSIRTAREVNRLEEAANDNQETGYIDGPSAIISKGFRFKREYFILIFLLIVVVGLSVTVAVLYNKNEFMGTKIDKIELELDDLKYHLKDIDNNHTLEVNLTRMELLSLNANITKNLIHQKTRVQEVNESLGSDVDRIELDLDELKSQFEENLIHQKTRVQEVNESLGSEIDMLKLELDELKSQFQACPSTSFHFPRVNQVIDYVQYNPSIPALNEFTVCMWLETDDYIGGRNTIFSYAVPNRHNELWIFFENPNDIGLGLYSSSAEAIILSHPRFVGIVTVHTCVSFSTFLQRAGLYLNGTLTSTTHTTKPSLQGGGTLVLGQDQDSVGGGFSSTQSYHGNITNVIIWPRVLSSQEISNVARRCVCPSDHVVAVTPESVTVFGNVIQSIPLRCPML